MTAMTTLIQLRPLQRFLLTQQAFIAFELAVAADAHDEEEGYYRESGFGSDEEADVFRRLQDFSDC